MEPLSHIGRMDDRRGIGNMDDVRSARTWKFRWNIRRKMLLFCLLLLIIPTSVIAYNGYSNAKAETDSLIRKNLENSVKLMVQNLNQLSEMAGSGKLSLEQAQEDAKIIMLGARQDDGTRPINRNIDLGDNGYFYVLDEKGVLLAHPSLEGDNLWDKKTTDGFYYIQDVIKQGQNGGGFTFYDWPLPKSDREALKITYALQFPEWDWIVVAGSYYQDYNGGQTRIMYETLIALAVCLVVGAVGVLLFSNHIANPITRIASVARRMAEGDLTSDDPLIRNRDEIGRLAGDFETMRRNLTALVQQLMLSSSQVSDASRTLQSSIEESAQASRHIAETANQVAAGMETQASSTEQSAKAMEQMAQGIERVADASSEAHEASVQSKQEAELGYDRIGQSIRVMQSVQQAVGDIAQVMAALGQRSQQIQGIVTIMSDIASQTSLLALNASIEAAKAGEQGRGFAVVASEVKKLAAMSEASSEQIGELVVQVQADIASAVRFTAAGTAQFGQGMQAIEQTGQAFGKIVESAQAVVEQIQEASASAEEMSASTEQIYASLQELDRIAGRSAASSETISAATEEQIAAMEQIAHSSQTLNQMAADLDRLAHQFRVREEKR